MTAGDFFECVTLVVLAPIATLMFLFLIATSLYVYFDTEERSSSHILAFLLTAATALCYWPISFLAYLVCTNILDNRRQRKTAQPG